jgi:type IV pilus assembly protein PilA
MTIDSHRRYPASRGFTLIELMLTITIVGILTAVALVQYQQYTTRIKVMEGLALAGPVKLAIAEYHDTQGQMPASIDWLALLEELGLPASTDAGAAAGQHVKRIWWDNTDHEIRIRFGGPGIDDRLLYLQADLQSNGAIVWTCLVPGDDTGIPPRHLPGECR